MLIPSPEPVQSLPAWQREILESRLPHDAPFDEFRLEEIDGRITDRFERKAVEFAERVAIKRRSAAGHRPPIHSPSSQGSATPS